MGKKWGRGASPRKAKAQMGYNKNNKSKSIQFYVAFGVEWGMGGNVSGY